MTPSPIPPPVSPTGQAVLSQILTRVAVAVFGIAGAIALAPTAGIDVSFLPAAVPKYCALIAFVAATLGLGGPGLRKMAPMVLLCLSLGFASCAHSEPLLVTRDSIVAAGQTFEATAAVMKQLDDGGQLSATQKQSWGAFKLRFKTSFHAARTLYDAAASGGDVSTQDAAARIIASFVTELGTYETLILQLMHPDGGGLS